MATPKELQHLQLNIRLSPELHRAIEAYRRAQEDIPTRSQAVKRMLREGLRVITAPDYVPEDDDAADCIDKQNESEEATSQQLDTQKDKSKVGEAAA